MRLLALFVGMMMIMGLWACNDGQAKDKNMDKDSKAASADTQKADQAKTAKAPAAKDKADKAAAPADGKNPVVLIKTNMGDIVAELYADKAPKSVANFLAYVDDNYYSGTIFHRVIDGFMIQGGGFTKDFQKKQTKAPIENEADNGLKNETGTLAMARTSDPHSATAQFFINVNDNAFLNHSGKNPRGWGYAVFGKVIEGMDVVNKIKAVKTGPGGPFPKDAPQTPVVIESVTRK